MSSNHLDIRSVQKSLVQCVWITLQHTLENGLEIPKTNINYSRAALSWPFIKNSGDESAP